MAASAEINRPMITVAIMAATIMQALDTTIANVALPHMQGSLSASQDQISWVLTSYIVAAAIMTPPTGWLAGRFGRKRLFAVVVAGFTVSSMLCGAAQSLDEMVVFRLLQGVFGAALVPLSQATMLDTTPVEQHGRAMAVWGMGVMVGPILGPTLGGWLTENWNWRWVFYINLPVGIVSLAGILAAMPETRIDRSRRLDWMGFAFLSLGIGALQMMLDRGETKDWFGSTEIVYEAILAAAGFYLFAAHSLTTTRPFLHPALFRDRNLMVGVVIMFLLGFVLIASLALLPTYLQVLMDYPVVTTGVVLAPRGIGTLFAMVLVGRYSNRVDARTMMLAGVVFVVHTFWRMAQWNLDVGIREIVTVGLEQGVGFGLMWPPLTVVSFSTLPPALRTEGAGLFSLMRNIGASIGVSLVETILSRGIQSGHSHLVQNITPMAAASGRLGPLANFLNPKVMALVDAEINRQAASVAYLNDYRLMLLLSVAIAPAVLLLRPPALPAGGPETPVVE